jgi:hypothetical protein
MNNLLKTFSLIALICTSALHASVAKKPSNLNADYKKLQMHINEFNKISLQFNQSKDMNKIDQLISNLETFTERKMSFIEKQFIKAEFSRMESMPVAELSPQEIKFYDETDSKKEVFLSMQIVDAEKNLFKYNNKVFELNPTLPIQDNLKVLINGLIAASN